MLKKNGGITLIALVVTIIVLLILAGITIAMLTGNNGIITRTNDSKMSQIEGQVKEEIKLAAQSAKIYATQKSIETPGGGWYASMHIEDTMDPVNTSVIKEKGINSVLEEDLTIKDGNGYTINKTTSINSTSSSTAAKIYITYTSSDYKAATNNQSAKIDAEITVTKNNIELTSFTPSR